MANFKRKKHKKRRAGCLMCKPHKMNGAGAEENKPSVRRKLQKEDSGPDLVSMEEQKK